MAFDFKKEYKEFYMPPNKPQIVDIPKANYIAVRGKGDPNEEGGAYQQAVSVLYSVAYTLKMSYKSDYKIDGFFEYVVPPLEGFWWQENVVGVDYSDKSTFNWISVIRLPDFITEDNFKWAVETASKKKKTDCSSAEYLRIHEGMCVQMMHIGPYNDEPKSVAIMNAFLEENGYITDINEKRKLILIHGFQMPYQTWNKYIDYYKNDFHIIVPIMPGHYPNHAENFVSFSETAKEFESYYISKYGEEVFAVYAMSMGGVLAAVLWQNRRLKIEKIIFDGSPLVPFNRFVKKMITGFYLNVTHKTQRRDKKTLEQAKNIYPQDSFNDFLKLLDTMTDTTIRNCIEGVTNFQLADNLDNQNTAIYYYFGTKFNEIMARKTAKFISNHYKNSVIKCFKGKSHCEMTLFFPELMVKELDEILRRARG